MSWHTSINGDVGLIFNGSLVVGSIEQRTVSGMGLRIRWHVQIVWSGPGGDIEGQFDDLPRALCFIEGVEKTMQRIIATSLDVLANDG